MKRYLVTGSTGLIGSHLLEELNKKGEVSAIYRKDPIRSDTPTNVLPIRLDLRKELNFGLLPQRLDAVIHLAQSEYFRDFPNHSLDLFQVNTVSTLRLLDYARIAGAKTFIYASSGGVYGYSEDSFTENAEINPHGDLGFYLGSKLCSEILSDCFTSIMNIIVLRFFFVYGPGQKKNMLIPRLVQSIIEGKPITLHGGDGIKINPTYVGDAVDAIIKSLALEKSQKVNVGGPEVLSMRQIGMTIGQVLGKEPVFKIQKDKIPHNIIGDIEKMTRLLWKPVWSFRKGLEQFVRIPKEKER